MPPDSWKGTWELPDVLLRPLSDADRRGLLALSCGGVGPGRLAKILRGAGSVEQVADRHRFAHDPTVRMDRVDELGVRVLAPSDDEYPDDLAEGAAPPPILYVRGERLDRLGPGVAIVGARACTSGAKRFTRTLACAIAEAGFTVVSGLARGIDGAAHTGALDGGRTVAVLGTGIERVYPAEHRTLAERILERGSLVTEFPPGTTPRRWHFPARNRIIAGLSVAVIVAEAGERSGALITAAFGVHWGREILVCTTGPENPAGAGIRELIRDGATVIVHPGDAVEALTDLARAQGYTLTPVEAHTEPGGVPDVDPQRADVYQAVTETSTVEDVAATAGVSVPEAASVLASLELDGLVIAEAGGRWSRRAGGRRVESG